MLLSKLSVLSLWGSFIYCSIISSSKCFDNQSINLLRSHQNPDLFNILLSWIWYLILYPWLENDIISCEYSKTLKDKYRVSNFFLFVEQSKMHKKDKKRVPRNQQSIGTNYVLWCICIWPKYLDHIGGYAESSQQGPKKLIKEGHKIFHSVGVNKSLVAKCENHPTQQN